jgi:hypothetical protein
MIWIGDENSKPFTLHSQSFVVPLCSNCFVFGGKGRFAPVYTLLHPQMKIVLVDPTDKHHNLVLDEGTTSAEVEAKYDALRLAVDTKGGAPAFGVLKEGKTYFVILKPQSGTLHHPIFRFHPLYPTPISP